MARRIAPKLSLPRRRALEAELLAYAELRLQAELDQKVHISRAFDAGMTLAEIAEKLDISNNTAHRWKNEGERERERLRPPGGPQSG